MRRCLRYLCLAAISLIPGQLSLHFWPEWSMVLGRRIDYLSPSINLTELVMLTTILLFVAFRWSDLVPRLLTGVAVIGSSPLAQLAVAFLFIHVASAVYPQLAAIAILRWILTASFFLVCFSLLITIREVQSALLFGLSVSGFLAVLQLFAQRSIGFPFTLLGERQISLYTPGIARFPICTMGGSCVEVMRPYATFPHPNVFAGYAVTVGICIHQLASRITKSSQGQKQISTTRQIRSAPLLVPALLTGVTILVSITLSRSAIIVWSAYLAATVFRLTDFSVDGKQISRRRWYTAVVTIIVLAVLPGVWMSFNHTPDSIIERITLATISLHSLMTSPFIGVGLNNAIPVSPVVTTIRDRFMLQPVHSIYLLSLTEGGIVLVGILLSSFRWFLSADQSGRHLLRMHSLSAYWPLLSLALVGLVDHYPLTVPQGRMMVCLAAYVTILLNRDSR